jgi:glutamate synthase (NADPH/NADH) large chain
MSGGRAFVYKLRADKINPEALANGELKLLELDDESKEALFEVLQDYQKSTGSLLAERILADFDKASLDFTLVMPRDYANVLEVRDEALALGLNPDGEETWKRILEVTNG